MTDQENQLQDLQELVDEETPSLVDRGSVKTETIDLQEMIRELDAPLPTPDSEGFQVTAFGKLLDSVPIPVFLLDQSLDVIFANQVCERLGPDPASIQGTSFLQFFPQQGVPDQVAVLARKVFSIRQTQVIEAVMGTAKRKLWGRVHLRPIRQGATGSILALVEDLTLEKSQLIFQKRLRKELERRVEERTRELAESNKKLTQEIEERRQVEKELTKHRRQLEELVVGRTAELSAAIKRLKQEIMERKRAAKSSEISQRHLEAAFRTNPAAACIFSLKDGRYTQVNEAFSRLTGFEPADIIGHTDEELNHWVRLTHRDQMVQALIKNGAVRSYESVFRSKDGQISVISVWGELMEIDGTPYAICIIKDITERKRAERTQSRLATAIELVTDTILITDSIGRIKYANPAFQMVSGYSQEEIIGTNVDLIQRTEQGNSILAEAKSVLVEGKSWTGRVKSRNKDHSVSELDATVSPVRGHGARAINLVIVEREHSLERISDKEAWQDEKREAGAQAVKRIAGVLENLLLGLMGYAYLAKDEVSESARRAGDLEQVLAIGKRARDLVGAIETLSGCAREPTTTVDIMEMSLAILQELKESKPENIEISHDVAPVETTVLASGEQVRLLISALFESACLIMEPEGGALSVSLSEEFIVTRGSRPPDGDPVQRAHARLVVSGTPRSSSAGEPMPNKLLDIPSSGNHVWTSLAVSRSVIEDLGGWLDIKSDEPAVVFSAYLPLVSKDVVHTNEE